LRLRLLLKLIFLSESRNLPGTKSLNWRPSGLYKTTKMNEETRALYNNLKTPEDFAKWELIKERFYLGMTEQVFERIYYVINDPEAEKLRMRVSENIQILAFPGSVMAPGFYKQLNNDIELFEFYINERKRKEWRDVNTNLTDLYIKKTLRQMGYKTEDIDKETIAVKRAVIQIKRELKNQKQ
jgi:hypothetical protein